MKKRKHKLIILMMMIGMMTLSMMRIAEVTFADNQVLTEEQNSETSQIIGDVTPTPERYFAYTKNEALNEVTITGLNESETPAITELIIPETIDGMKVTTIEAHAFRSKEFLISVIIPDSVESIGEQAFCYCRELSSVKIGNSVKSIGRSAFERCDSLTAVDIPDSVESIGESAFANTPLSSVKIGNSVNSIGKYAFKRCSLTAVDIPDSVESIGPWAFSGCSNLSSVKIGNSVKSIGDGAFGRCANLSTVKIGNSVKSIGENAFYESTSLTSVVLPNTLTSLASDAFESSSINNLIFICQDINDMNISVSDSIPEGINVYRMAMNQEIKAKENEIASYEFIGETVLLKDLFEIGAIYIGGTGTEKYEGSEIKFEDYFDISVISYALIGDKTSNDTKIEDNQLHIGKDETSDSLSIQVTHGEINKQIPIQIIKAKLLSIKEEPQNTYDENKTYDPNGLVLTMTYEDGYEKDIEYHTDNDEITFEYQTVDMNITEQIIKYKGLEVKQPLTIYGHHTLNDSETKIEITGILTNNSSLKIEKIKDAATLYTFNGKEIIIGYDVQIIGEYKDKLTIVFDVGHKNNGKKVYIRHIKHDGSLEEFEETVSEGKIDIEVTELSPFLIYKDEERVEEPDNNKPDIDIDHYVPSEPVPEIPVITPDKPVSDIPVIRPIGGENISDKEIWTIQGSMIPTGDNQAILLWGIIGIIGFSITIFSIKKRYRIDKDVYTNLKK